MVGRHRADVLVAFHDQVDRATVPQYLRSHAGYLLEDHVQLEGRIEQLGSPIQEGRVPFPARRLLVQEGVLDRDPDLVEEATLVGVEAPRRLRE